MTEKSEERIRLENEGWKWDTEANEFRKNDKEDGMDDFYIPDSAEEDWEALVDCVFRNKGFDDGVGLCEDEGCSHHGTPHVCVNIQAKVLEAIDHHVTDDEDRMALRAKVKQIYDLT